MIFAERSGLGWELVGIALIALALIAILAVGSLVIDAVAWLVRHYFSRD